jgi:hypothetical protein
MDRTRLSTHNTEYVYSTSPVDYLESTRINYFTCRGKQ